MNTKKAIRLYIRLYLGVAGEREKRKLFKSGTSGELLHAEWEASRKMKAQSAPFDKNALLQRIEQQISVDPAPSDKRREVQFLRRYAAIFITGLLLVSGGIYLGLDQRARRYATMEISSIQAGRSEFVLPDGSRVVLNNRSTLSYPKTFHRRNRSVSMTGEAYFDVVHEPDRPFFVNASDIAIEVLGTCFNVTAYPGDEIIETILVSGKVRISRKNPGTQKTQSVILSPDHKARFIKKEERFILDKVDAPAAVAWKTTSLSFDNEPFESVVKKLETWYEVKIKLGENVKQEHRLTMTIDRESFEEVLAIIEKTLPLDYRWTNGEIVFFQPE